MLVTTLTAWPARGAEMYPFGSHPMRYAAGTIRPNRVSPDGVGQCWQASYQADIRRNQSDTFKGASD